MIGDAFDLHGWLWDRVGNLGDHFGTIGVGIVCLFVLSWVASAALYRLLGYNELEAEAVAPE